MRELPFRRLRKPLPHPPGLRVPVAHDGNGPNRPWAIRHTTCAPRFSEAGSRRGSLSLYLFFYMAGAEGLEPPVLVLETSGLPVNRRPLNTQRTSQNQQRKPQLFVEATPLIKEVLTLFLCAGYVYRKSNKTFSTRASFPDVGPEQIGRSSFRERG